MKKVTSRDGTTIAFDQSGKGPALILVGGAFEQRAMDSETAQLAALPLLAQHFTVFHYDRRGRGDSTDTQPYAVEREIPPDCLLQFRIGLIAEDIAFTADAGGNQADETNAGADFERAHAGSQNLADQVAFGVFVDFAKDQFPNVFRNMAGGRVDRNAAQPDSADVEHVPEALAQRSQQSFQNT